ncbi:helix-turn-helix domain-containing protein [Kribbella sp. NPDC050470]|uniref:helix-turn-helix domain-containing protein n=1 Tax=unclassified Kribbella TaxID=2644121 RepID=UPI0037905AAC
MTPHPDEGPPGKAERAFALLTQRLRRRWCRRRPFPGRSGGNARNRRQTAADLHVHANTVDYRLRQVGPGSGARRPATSAGGRPCRIRRPDIGNSSPS